SQTRDNRNPGVAKYGLKTLSTNPVLTHLLKTTPAGIRYENVSVSAVLHRGAGRREGRGDASSTSGKLNSPTEIALSTKGKGCWLMSSSTGNQRGAAVGAAAVRVKCQGGARFGQPTAAQQLRMPSADDAPESEIRLHALHEFFEAQVDSRQEAVAAVCGRE